MTTKVTFNKDYQALFQEILQKLNKNSPIISNPQLSPLNPSSNFSTNKSDSKKSQTNQKTRYFTHLKHTLVNPQMSSIQNQMKPIKQTRYFAFGQSSPAKSLQLRKTFVNLGNNRYQINRSPQSDFYKTQTFLLRNMEFQKSTYNVNNLAFPIINEKSKKSKNFTSSLPLNQESPKISNRMRDLSKRRRSRNGNSLQLKVQIKSLNSKSLPKKSSSHLFPPQILFNNSEKQQSPFKSISSISKSVDLQASQFLKQMIFAKQYEKKLHQIQKNIILKKRLQNLKQKKRNKQQAQKEPIDPWKYQRANLNTPMDIQEIFDGFTKKPSFF